MHVVRLQLYYDDDGTFNVDGFPDIKQNEWYSVYFCSKEETTASILDERVAQRKVDNHSFLPNIFIIHRVYGAVVNKRRTK